MGTRVPAVGPRDADIVFVGEAPATQEVRAGEPFVGPAGKQFDSMLQSAGISRRDVYITNLVKEPLPSDDKQKQAALFQGKAPTQLLMNSIVELVEELRGVRNRGGAKVVVPLGNYALWALTRRMGITRWRGSIMESNLLQGQKVIPTIHPAYYIHKYYFNLCKEPLGIWDLTRIQEESKTYDINLPQYDFWINPTGEDLDRAADRLLSAEVITCDTEWYGPEPEKLAYIGFTDCTDWAICVPYRGMQSLRFYRKILESSVPKIWHNAMFDDVALSRLGIEVRNVKHDTMVAWHNCWTDIKESKNLAVVCSVLTRQPYYKDSVGFIGRDDDKGQRYCCTDCVVEHQAWEKIDKEEFDYTRGRRGYEISMSVYPIFSAASKKGIRADIDWLKKEKIRLLERADELEEIVGQILGHSINCRSAPQVAKAVYDELGVKRAGRTTKQEVLMDIAAASDDKEIQALLTTIIRVRQDRNMVSRYVDAEKVVDTDGRIRTNWNLAGTRSGRFSSSDPWWNGLAIQTVPEEARYMFIPDDGYTFIGWDFEQAEARVVAIKTHDEQLIEDMNTGVDIHTKLAAKLPFGMTYDQLVEKINAAVKAGKSKDSVKERYLSKKCRHALNYVMGPGTFQMTVNKFYLDTGIGLNPQQAKALRAAYLDLHPGLNEWWNNVKSRIYKSPRQLTNYFGRTRNFLGLVDNVFTEAVSYEPQSTVADLNTLCIAEVDPLLKELDPTAQCFAHMHDGGFYQIRTECVPEAAAIIKKTFTKQIRIDRTPLIIPVEVKIGMNWAQMDKFKEAA